LLGGRCGHRVLLSRRPDQTRVRGGLKVRNMDFTAEGGRATLAS
jgi:hypothetical protein